MMIQRFVSAHAALVRAPCFRSLPVRGGRSLAVAQAGEAQSLSYSRGQNISPAYEGLGAGRRRDQVLPVRLHEPQLGGRDRRPGRRRQRDRARAGRPGAADALPAAAQPLRVPRAGAEELHREGRARLDAHRVRQGREGLRDAPSRLPRGRRRARLGNRRAWRRNEQPGSARQQAADRQDRGLQNADAPKSGSRSRSRRSSPTMAFRSRDSSSTSPRPRRRPRHKKDAGPARRLPVPRLPRRAAHQHRLPRQAAPQHRLADVVAAAGDWRPRRRSGSFRLASHRTRR